MAGLAWVQGLSRRNPMIASGKAQNLSTRRAQKLKRFIVIGHFSKLTTTLEEPGLLDKPERIYNVDDKGCRSYLHKQRRGRPGPSAPAGLFVSQRTGSHSAGISCTTHELFCP